MAAEPPEGVSQRVARCANAVLDLAESFARDGPEAHHLRAALEPEYAAACSALADRVQSILERFPGWPAGTQSLSEVRDGLELFVDRQLDRAEAALDAAGREPDAAPPRAAAPARHVAGLARPQERFAVPVDNRAETPFLPLEHPLREELVRLTAAGAWQLATPEPQPPLPLEASPCVLVDTEEGLAALAAALRGEKEVAVDLEANSYRSFQGFVCLMQISSRSCDWLVDTLALREHIRGHLGPFFRDASVVKVMHGADGDVVWLQRDFGIHLAGLFDTHQAARLLQLPGLGLAHLLSEFAGFQADKRFQLADWRLRPLTADMVKYARCDTHFLLSIFDQLRLLLCAAPSPGPAEADADLLRILGPLPAFPSDAGALPACWARSAAVSLRVYTKEQPPGLKEATALARAAGRPLSPMQQRVLFALMLWRDAAARVVDESRGYVLPNAAMLKLAAAGHTTRAAVAQLCVSSGAQFAAARAEEVAACIFAARTEAEAAEAAEAAAAASAAAEKGRAPMPPSTHVRFDADEALPVARPAKRRAIAVVTAPGGGSGLGGGLRD